MATAAAPKKGCKLDKVYPPVMAVVDIGVGIFLAVIAANAVRTAQFQSIVLGIIEFIVGVIYALCAIIKLQPINYYAHLFYTTWGRGVLALMFGVLGLSGDPLRYFFAAVTIAIGLLHLVIGCIWRLSPRPFIDCTSGEEGPGAAPRAGAATPVVTSGGAKTTAGQAAFGDNGATAPPLQSNPFAPSPTAGGGTGAAKK